MNEAQLRDIIGKLSANENVIGLVKMMEPLDIVAVITVDLDLQKDEAENIVANLLKNAMEGMALPGIETNKQYPVPSKIRRDNEDLDEDYVNNLGQQTPDIKKYQFPEPRPDPEGWPYDAMTKAAMDPHNKGKKRPLMQGPFDPNLKKNQPGGDGGKGIYFKNAPHADNSYQGRPGWSSSPSGKEFDSDVELNVQSANPEMPSVGDDEAPVGSPIPKFAYGSSEPRKNGERTGFRRK